MINERIPLSAHIDRFRKIHGDLFEYPEQEFQNSHSKLRIICRKHGEFSLHIFTHADGRGCPSCRYETTKTFKKSLLTRKERIQPTIDANKLRQISKEEVELLCREQHGDKFSYKWIDYRGKSGRVLVVCKEHGESNQIIDEHLKAKHGCPGCSRYSFSADEKIWISQFDLSDCQYKIKLNKTFIKVDGYNSTTNTIYEYLGNYWHGHPVANPKRFNGMNKNNKLSFDKLFHLTEERFRLLKSMNYNIIYVWENDINL